MSHPRPEDLSAYIDGALSDGQQQVIADHLTSCRTCSASVREWESMRAVIRAASSVEPEAWFAERMETMVVGEEADVERWEGPERVAARTVLGLALVVVGLVVAMTLRSTGTATPIDRAFAIGSGDTTLLLASTELTRDNLLQATIDGE